MTPRNAPHGTARFGMALAALGLLSAGCAQPSPAPAPVIPAVARPLTAPEPAPVPSVESWRRSPAGGPGVTHRESQLPDAGAQGNASLDGTLPDLARPRLQLR
jgi:hypothetical protein